MAADFNNTPFKMEVDGSGDLSIMDSSQVDLFTRDDMYQAFGEIEITVEWSQSGQIESHSFTPDASWSGDSSTTLVFGLVNSPAKGNGPQTVAALYGAGGTAGPEVTVSGSEAVSSGTGVPAVIDPHQQLADNIVSGIISDVGLTQAGTQLGIEFADFTNALNTLMQELPLDQGADTEFADDLGDALGYMVQELHPAIAQVALETLTFIEGQSEEAIEYSPLLNIVVPMLQNRILSLKSSTDSQVDSYLDAADARLAALTKADIKSNTSAEAALNRAYQRYVEAKSQGDIRVTDKLAAAELEWREEFRSTVTYVYKGKAFILGADSDVLRVPQEDGNGAIVPVGQAIPAGMDHAGTPFGGGMPEFEAELLSAHDMKRANAQDVANGDAVAVGDVIHN